MIFLDATDKRIQDLLPNLLQKRGIQSLRRAEGSHTSGVRSSIPVIELLMILRRGEEQVGVTVHQGMDRALDARRETLR